LWKLSGLFDLTIGQSLQAGVVDLETVMAAHGNDHLVVFGVSQGGVIAAIRRSQICVVGPHPSGVDSRRQYPAC
jgi:PE-PPE domain